MRNSLARQAPLPRDSPGKNIGVGCHFLLQGIFPEPLSPVSPALAGRFFTTEPPRKHPQKYCEGLKRGRL